MAKSIPLTTIFFTAQAKADIAYWSRENPKILEKISALIEDIMTNPTEGIGRPKALRYHLEGAWSRRINHEHRLVYTFSKSTLNIIQARYHYEA